jgi:hypothetical protein
MNTPTQPNDGGPAFPVLRETENPSIPLFMASSGMTLRDWFAGKALQALIVRDSDDSAYDIDMIKAWPQIAYEYADAMLAARNTNTTAQ